MPPADQLKALVKDHQDLLDAFEKAFLKVNGEAPRNEFFKKNYPPPEIFQQSLGWLDEQGNRIRYNNINHNEPDQPPPAIRGR